MKKIFFVTLLRERKSENSIWSDAFLVETEGEDVETILRSTIDKYLKTPEGQKAIEDTSYDFNWGDVVNYIPYSFWDSHGIKVVGENTTISADGTETIIVDQDELLASMF